MQVETSKWNVSFYLDVFFTIKLTKNLFESKTNKTQHHQNFTTLILFKLLNEIISAQ